MSNHMYAAQTVGQQNVKLFTFVVSADDLLDISHVERLATRAMASTASSTRSTPSGSAKPC